jgi:hypothetical protein
MSVASRFLLIAALALGSAHALAAEPPFEVTEDGSVFLYRARPGDVPGTVAAMFGVAPADVPAFLAANGITDATRVGVGHEYRIPNPLAQRAAEAVARAQALDRGLVEQRARAEALARDLASARAMVTAAERRAGRLAWFEWAWPIVVIAGTVLVLAAGAAIAFAVAVGRRTGTAERYARVLANDLEDKRRSALAERQSSAKRILELETAMRDLEMKVGSAAAARRRPIAG